MTYCTVIIVFINVFLYNLAQQAENPSWGLHVRRLSLFCSRYVPTSDDVEMYKSHKGPVAELHIVDQYMMEVHFQYLLECLHVKKKKKRERKSNFLWINLTWRPPPTSIPSLQFAFALCKTNNSNLCTCLRPQPPPSPPTTFIAVIFTTQEVIRSRLDRHTG